MAKILFADKASTTMTGSLASGLGTLTVASGGGAKFPSPTGGNFFYATLYQKDGGGSEINVEIVKITAKPSADSFTISERDVTNITGYGGGYAYPGTAGTVYVELRWLEKAATAMMQTDDLTAVNIKNTPAGGIAATTVQAALNELDTEKAPLASPAFTGTPTVPTAGPGTNTTQAASTAFVTGALNTHTGASSAHGTTSAVIGINDTQTLTNKTISADSNTISGIAASSFVLSNASGNLDGAAAQKVIPAGVVVGTTDTQTLTNKTVSLGSNTVSGTAAQFNTACTDNDFAFVTTNQTFSGANEFTQQVKSSKARTTASWTEAQFQAYSNAGATIDFSSIAYHVQDATNAPQWGFNSGDGSRFGLYNSDGTARLFTFPVGGIGSGLLKATSNDLSVATAGTDYLAPSAIGSTVQAYDADIPTVSASQAEMEAGTETALRSMSPLRVKQAIAALAPAPTVGYTYANATDTTAYLATTGTTLQARIQGVVTGGVNMPGANTLNSVSVVGVVTGSSCVVDVLYQGTTSYMATTLTFPSSGTYLVQVNAACGGNGATYRNHLSAFAIKVA